MKTPINTLINEIESYNNTLVRNINGNLYIDTMKNPKAFARLVNDAGYMTNTLHTPPKGHKAHYGIESSGFKVDGIEFYCNAIKILT